MYANLLTRQHDFQGAYLSQLVNPGAGGRVGTGSSLGAYVRKMAAIEVDKDQDPREALLKYAKVGRTLLLALVFIGWLEACCDDCL